MIKEDKALQDLKKEIAKKLPEYLGEHGVDFIARGKDYWFECINPDHQDSDPSMHFVKESDNSLCKCFSCGATFGIFHAANIFEGKPLEGKGFVENNVYYLADKYKIPYERRELDEAELLIMRIQQTFEATAHVLREHSKKSPDVAFHYTRTRGLGDELCLRMGVGTMDWSQYLKAMNDYGRFKPEWIKSIGILEDHIGNEHITFILRDESGTAVGVDRRWMGWNKTDRDAARAAKRDYRPKYRTIAEDKARVYKKDHFVYGLYSAKKYMAELERIDLVEGFTDALALMQAGHKVVGALCGSALTPSQIETIKRAGFTNMNLVLDGDQAGHDSMETHLESMKGIEGIRPSITMLGFEENTPPEDRDPCGWVQRYGLEQFLAQPRTSAFEWEIGRLLQQQTPYEEVAEKMVGFIVNESSAIQRSHLINELSRRTGVSAESITEEVQKHTDRTVDDIWAKVNQKVRRAKTSKEKASLLNDAARAAQNATNDVGKEELTVAAAASNIQRITQSFLETKPGLPGWDSGISCINKNMGGIPKSKEIIGFGGNANTGKSTILYNILYGLLTHDNPGLTCLFWTLDDPIEIVVAKLLALRTHYPITHCRYPGSHGLKNDIVYRDAMDWVNQTVIDQKLVVRGVDIGSRPMDCDKLIKTTQDETSNDLVVFVDSFHNIGGMSDDERLNFKRAAEWQQEASDMKEVTFINSLECNKQATNSGRPRIGHLAESAKIAFAFKMVSMVYSDFNENRENAKLMWHDKESGKDRPVLVVSYEKNKITDFKGDEYYKFHDDKALLEETTLEEIEKDREENQVGEVEEMTGVKDVDVTSTGVYLPPVAPTVFQNNII